MDVLLSTSFSVRRAKIIVAPSILAADFPVTETGHPPARKKPALTGSIWTSWTAISSITFPSGPPSSPPSRKHAQLPLDVHLMIEHHDRYLPRLLEAGANSISVHVEPSETRRRANAALATILAPAGYGVGLTLNPATPFEASRALPLGHRSSSHLDCPSRFRRPEHSAPMSDGEKVLRAKRNGAMPNWQSPHRS